MTTKGSGGRQWTREESLIVFNLYCRIPFKDSNRSHPDVQHIARLIDRTPDAVNMKIGNLGSLDPELKKQGIRGLANASRLDQATWDEFHADWEARIKEKLNPSNGLCLNALHDKAFDRGLIAVNDDYTVAVSSVVSQSSNDAVRRLLLEYESQKIKLPSRFHPHPEFLQWHRNNVFEH